MTPADHLHERFLRTEEVNGLGTRVYDIGYGDPVLLIHGGQFGSLYSLDAWSLNLDPMSRDRRIVAYDRPGQGWTDAPDSPLSFVMETVTTHAYGVLRDVVGRPAHVVGHSRGGAVAARLAIEHTDMVRSLTVVDSGSMAPLDPAVPVGGFYAAFERTIDGGGPDGVRAEPEAQAADSRWITDDFVARMTAIANRPETRAVRTRFAAAELEHWRPSLERCRIDTLRRIDAAGLPVPTLVMWGYADRSAPRHLGHRLFERIAAKTDVAAFAMVNHAGHYLFRDRPDWFASTLAAFWESVGG